MFVGTQQTKEQKELNTRERKGQDATNISSVPAESCIQFLWSVMLTSMTALTWMVKNILNRTTIEDFTDEIDEARCVRQYNYFHLLMRLLCLCLSLMNLLHSVAPPSFWLCDHGDINTTLGREFRDYCYEALAFSRHTIDLEFDDETMRSEKATEAPTNARRDPSTMKMKQWYQKHTRVSDQKGPTGTEQSILPRTGTN